MGSLTVAEPVKRSGTGVVTVEAGPPLRTDGYTGSQSVNNVGRKSGCWRRLGIERWHQKMFQEQRYEDQARNPNRQHKQDAPQVFGGQIIVSNYTTDCLSGVGGIDKDAFAVQIGIKSVSCP